MFVGFIAFAYFFFGHVAALIIMFFTILSLTNQVFKPVADVFKKEVYLVLVRGMGL